MQSRDTPSLKTERRNYWVFLTEGGMFVFGMGFVNAQTFLPAVILEEGGPGWLAAYIPALMIIGLFGVPVLTARFTDQLPRLKPYIIFTGILQRIVYIFAALILIFGDPSPFWTVAVLAGTPLLSGLFGGLGFTAWQRMYILCVPPARRASNIAYRFLFGGITGILAGWSIEHILAAHPGNVGYGYLHLLAAVCVMGSLGCFMYCVEPAQNGFERAKVRKSVRATLLEFYRARATRKSRVSFTLAVLLMHSFLLLPPFYATSLLHRLGEASSYLGVLAMWQMGGQAVGNFSAAFVGDHWGGRATLAFGLLALCGSALMALLVATPLHAQLAYAFFGFSQMLAVVGKDTLVMELGPEKNQSGYLSMMSLMTMCVLGLIGFLCQWLWRVGGLEALVGTMVLLCVASFVCLAWVQDPRAKRLPTLRAIRRGFIRLMR